MTDQDRVLVAYGTKYGSTAEIAERIGATLRAGRTTISAVGPLFLETMFSTTASSICAGDSGGPILVSQGSAWAIAGVSSAASVAQCNSGTNFYINIRNGEALSFVRDRVPAVGGI